MRHARPQDAAKQTVKACTQNPLEHPLRPLVFAQRSHEVRMSLPQISPDCPSRFVQSTRAVRATVPRDSLFRPAHSPPKGRTNTKAQVRHAANKHLTRDLIAETGMTLGHRVVYRNSRAYDPMPRKEGGASRKAPRGSVRGKAMLPLREGVGSNDEKRLLSKPPYQKRYNHFLLTISIPTALHHGKAPFSERGQTAAERQVPALRNTKRPHNLAQRRSEQRGRPTRASNSPTQ